MYLQCLQSLFWWARGIRNPLFSGKLLPLIRVTEKLKLFTCRPFSVILVEKLRKRVKSIVHNSHKVDKIYTLTSETRHE